MCDGGLATSGARHPPVGGPAWRRPDGPRSAVYAGDAWQRVRQYGFAHLEWTTQLG